MQTENSPSVIRVTLEHPSEAHRRVSISLSLGTDGDASLLDCSKSVNVQMKGIDQSAATYSLENWKSAILSGAIFGFRLTKTKPTQLFLHELEGNLASNDLDHLATAASLSVIHLVGGKDHSATNGLDWKCRIERLTTIKVLNHESAIPAVNPSLLPAG